MEFEVTIVDHQQFKRVLIMEHYSRTALESMLVYTLVLSGCKLFSIEEYIPVPF